MDIEHRCTQTKPDSNKRRIILFVSIGQDAYHTKNQQTFRSNKKRIILFVILGQDAHPTSTNKDFNQCITKEDLDNFGVYLPHFQPPTIIQPQCRPKSLTSVLEPP
ncbi:hypothetical protein HZH66_003397 [Vespula vulgaris]|uniref:Uncharacterized protein n=1 Tax=Vespula vulgaris TaxID=7454 RepID=A0A834KI58_VESVU|nr:hypothetical protein HZH66_003397 [Vespula vulgaris]